jgi:hypothetical protein
MFAARVGGLRRDSPRYSYNTSRAGPVDGAGYPVRERGVVFFLGGGGTNVVNRCRVQKEYT